MTYPRVVIAGALALLLGLPPIVAMAANQGNPPVQLPPVAPPVAPTVSQPGLSDTPWQWQSTRHADGTTTSVAEPARYTIAFQAQGMLNIRADCNTVLGTYSVNGAALTIQLGPSTLVGCPPDSQADQFVADLSQVASYTVGQGSLRLGLRTPGGEMLLAPRPLPELVGPDWQLNAYNNGRGGVQSVLADSKSDAVFGTDGRVTGSAGCNRYMGGYQASSGSLTIGPLATTRMACEQALMDQEAAYIQALESTAEYAFDNDMLVLRDASGAIQAIFVLPTP
jgi:heat shock protein HslJ